MGNIGNMYRDKRRTYGSSTLPGSIRIRELESKDYGAVQRIYGSCMIDNIPYAISYTMQHRYILVLWVFLTYATVKNYPANGIPVVILMLCGWGVFIYLNVRKIITHAIITEARRVLLHDFFNIHDHYKIQATSTDSNDDKDSSHGPESLSRFWVAMDKDAGNRVVGFVAVIEREEDTKLTVIDREPSVLYLCILSEYRCRGIATALLDHATRDMFKRGVKWISCVVNTWQYPALNIFYKFGFREVARASVFYGFTENVKMRLDIEEWDRCRKARRRKIDE
ncbi:3825_t:CDS:2 [Paraglomus occultum]|uniref:3825_t:CDS:1 n=1 Tax=Paraglomus occultum TaxID=144539 RepID=A0A9N9AKA1_9GLOM|nr:3825_t:CDS:2 [Paraglomus occultum]